MRRKYIFTRLSPGQVPVPEIIYAHPQQDGDVGPHVLMQWMEGVTFQKFRKSCPQPNEVKEASRAIGATLARFGSFTFPCSAVVRLPIGTSPDGPDPIPARVEKWLASPGIARRLPSVYQDRVRAFVDGYARAFSCLDKARSLVHSDFGSRNLLLHRAEGRWMVSAVLDWEFAFIGSPLWDIGHFLRYERPDRPVREPHFSASFRDGGGVLPDDWRDLSRAVDLTRYIKSRHHRNYPREWSMK